jgi:hypothetical protein
MKVAMVPSGRTGKTHNCNLYFVDFRHELNISKESKLYSFEVKRK